MREDFTIMPFRLCNALQQNRFSSLIAVTVDPAWQQESRHMLAASRIASSGIGCLVEDEPPELITKLCV